MIAVVAAFNQENALVGAFSVIVKPIVKPMDQCTALALSWDEWGAGHLVDGYTGSTLYTQHLDCRGTASGDIIITLYRRLSCLVFSECLASYRFNVEVWRFWALIF